MSKSETSPIINQKYYGEQSVFRPENLLREARRQMQIKECPVPEVCLLDPDGDLVNYLKRTGEAEKNECWACYHSELYTHNLNGMEIGIIPCVVGASYAVLVAEQLFVSGCNLLLSVTSAGIVTEQPIPKRFALLTEAIRDEGTSYHYLPPDQHARIPTHLQEQLQSTPANTDNPFFAAKSWTTDAPYRETQPALDAMRATGAVCVEMEAAALYAFAQKTGNDVICFAHLTNTMARNEGDFEKGEEFGSLATIELIGKTLDLLVKN